MNLQEMTEALREWVSGETGAGYRASEQEVAQMEEIISALHALADVAGAAEPLVRRHREWLKKTKNPDGSAKATYVGDVLTENLIRKFKVLEERHSECISKNK